MVCVRSLPISSQSTSTLMHLYSLMHNKRCPMGLTILSIMSSRGVNIESFLKKIKKI